jgi:hypothetical protein
VPSVRIGRRVLFAREDLEAYLEQKKNGQLEEPKVRAIRPYAPRKERSGANVPAPEIPAHLRVKRRLNLPKTTPAWCRGMSSQSEPG